MFKMINNFSGSVEPNHIGESLEASEVGTRVHRLRLRYGMSQRKLAKLAGVTNGAISMIEQNRVSPSVASLKKILEVFGVTLSEFFSSDFDQDVQVFYRAHEMTRIADERVILRQVGANITNRKLQVLHETYAPGGDTGAEMLSHDGEEAGVVVRGQIEITIGGQCERLGPGDGYYFNSRLPHRFHNVGKEVCEIVSACTPPTF
jgi:transcriptional regulator with XRE-family HTH domain